MEKETLAIQGIFQGLDSSFGLNQAKIFCNLLQNSHKTAMEVIAQTQIYKSVAYRILSEMMQKDLVKVTHTRPKLYYLDSPVKIVDRLIRQKIRELESKKPELKELLASGKANENGLGEYLLKLENGQAKIIDKVHNIIVKDVAEIERIKRQLEELARQKTVQIVTYR